MFRITPRRFPHGEAGRFPNSTDVSFNCKILYNQTVGAATHIVLAVSNSGATTFVGGNAEIFGAQGSATPTMAIITAAGSGVSGPTVTAVGTGTGDTYVANVTGSIEVGGTAGSTSTVSIEYAAGASSTTFSIDRGSYCNLW